MSFIQNRVDRSTIGVDWLLVAFMVPVLLAGLVTMKSFTEATPYFSHQIIWIIISFTVFFTFSFIDFRFLKRTDVLVIFFIDITFCFWAYFKWSEVLVFSGWFFISAIRYDEACCRIDARKIFFASTCRDR